MNVKLLKKNLQLKNQKKQLSKLNKMNYQQMKKAMRMTFGKKNLGQDVWIQNNITSVTWPKQLVNY